MFSEYETGQLKPPIYYKDNIVDPEHFYGDEPEENLVPYLRNRNRLLLNPKTPDNNYPTRLSDLVSNRNIQEPDYAEDDDRIQYHNDNELGEAGVYTEGGLIYDNASPQQKASE